MTDRWILQFCHCHYGPFLDVARQYSSLFQGSSLKVLTVFLTGEPDHEVELGATSDEVIFLNFRSKDVRGLKLGAIRALKKIAESRDFAFVIAHRFKPIYIACMATQLPIIGVHHAFGDYGRPARRWFANVFKKRLALLGVSDAVRDELRRDLPSWPAERIETLHNRLDLALARAAVLPKDQARIALNLPVDATIIGNVGRLHPDKDQLSLLSGFAQALPSLPSGTLLVVAGSGPLEQQLHAHTAMLGIVENTRFLGQVRNVKQLFSAFDLFVLSSDHEPFGMVLLEAMAAGVPVMATNCGGAPEVVGNSNLLFGLRDTNQLASMLVEFFARNDATGRQRVAVDAVHRLERLFSDAAARQRFFTLSMVKAALGTC